MFPNHHCPCGSGCKNLRYCTGFHHMSPERRHGFVTGARLCVRCFSNSHSVDHCRSPQRCTLCVNFGTHHDLLHHYFVPQSLPAIPTTAQAATTPTPLVTKGAQKEFPDMVLLPRADLEKIYFDQLQMNARLAQLKESDRVDRRTKSVLLSLEERHLCLYEHLPPSCSPRNHPCVFS